jgi:nicotinamide-nucleotide amidase
MTRYSRVATMASDDTLGRLAADLGNALRARGWAVTTAESCTGGWIAKSITDIAGSSEWYGRGYVTYSNPAKAQMLGVPAPLIERHGAVSHQTAEAMAKGALRDSGADVAVAVTGIAGPGGGSGDKPVGTVWFAWASCKDCHSLCRHFAGDREAVRRQAVHEALAGLLALLE